MGGTQNWRSYLPQGARHSAGTGRAEPQPATPQSSLGDDLGQLASTVSSKAKRLLSSMRSSSDSGSGSGGGGMQTMDLESSSGSPVTEARLPSGEGLDGRRGAGGGPGGSRAYALVDDGASPGRLSSLNDD